MTPSLLVDVLASLLVLFGLAFMTVGAIGLARLPDLYHRMHAATKGVTLGIIGIGLGVVVTVAWYSDDTTVIGAITLLIVVLLFQFVANPVGAHMLAKAAHLDGVAKWHGTFSDELQESGHEANPAPPRVLSDGEAASSSGDRPAP